MKKIAILGSTGSIGTQTLRVIEENRDKFEVCALVANSNKTLILRQKEAFSVNFVGLLDESVQADDGIVYGEKCLEGAVVNADLVVVATRGIVALPAVLTALKQGKDVAIANKEIVVSAGKLLVEAAKEGNTRILPIDSEHSAVFQCLQGQNDCKKIILTCSGGSFLGKTQEQLEKVSPEQTLNHPRWRMGKKITVDSATLVNKGFEVLEAHWFFNVDVDDIEVVVHPESVVHSAVEFCDGSVIAQMGVTDMRLPIAYALNYPMRLKNSLSPLDLVKMRNLSFFGVDHEAFRGIDICLKAYKAHELMPAVLVSADEVAVDAFLAGKIGFLDIYRLLNETMAIYKNRVDEYSFTVSGIMRLDADVRRDVTGLIEEK